MSIFFPLSCWLSGSVRRWFLNFEQRLLSRSHASYGYDLQDVARALPFSLLFCLSLGAVGTSHFSPFGFILLLSLQMKLFAPSFCAIFASSSCFLLCSLLAFFAFFARRKLFPSAAIVEFSPRDFFHLNQRGEARGERE